MMRTTISNRDLGGRQRAERNCNDDNGRIRDLHKRPCGGSVGVRGVALPFARLCADILLNLVLIVNSRFGRSRLSLEPPFATQHDSGLVQSLRRSGESLSVLCGVTSGLTPI